MEIERLQMIGEGKTLISQKLATYQAQSAQSSRHCSKSQCHPKIQLDDATANGQYTIHKEFCKLELSRTLSVPNLSTVPPKRFHWTVILVAVEPSMLPVSSWAVK